MPRLYIPPQPQPVALAGPVAQPPADPSKAPKEFAAKITSLIPSEIIVAFLAITKIVPTITSEPMKKWTYIISFLICLILTPFYLRMIADRSKPYKVHLVLSTIAFIVWAYVTAGLELTISLGINAEYYSAGLASVVLILFTLFSGLIPMKS